MTKKNITLDPETAQAIKDLAKKQGRSQSAIIREALQEYVRENLPLRSPGLELSGAGVPMCRRE